jgi:Sugar phosphate isomerases/epimerases
MSNNLKIGFSLDMINIHYQEPNRNRYESKYYWEELYPLVVAAGFTAVEIPFDPFWIFRGGSGVPMTKYCIEVKFKTVANYVNHLKQQGINKIAGIHFTPNLFMRNDNLDFYFGASGYFGGEAIRYAKELGCDYINVSPTPPYGLIKHYHGNTSGWEKWLDEFIERTAALINGFAEVAKENSITLALRNEYWSLLRGDTILEFLKKIDPSVRLDIDSAHAAITGKDPRKMVKDRIDLAGSVHLTDTAFEDNAEIWKTPNPEFPCNKATQVFRDLGFGKINLGEFYKTLQSVNYDGWAICSCRQTREPMRALLRSRSYINNHFI